MLKIYESKIAWRPDGFHLVKDKETGQMVTKKKFERVGPRVEIADLPSNLTNGQKVYLEHRGRGKESASVWYEEITAHGTQYTRTAVLEKVDGKPVLDAKGNKVYRDSYSVKSFTTWDKDKVGLRYHKECPIVTMSRNGDGKGAYTLRQFKIAYDKIQEQILAEIEKALQQEAEERAARKAA